MRSTFEELSGSILPYTKAHVLSFVHVAKRKREVRLKTCANFSFYTWLSNLDILCTRRPCKLSVTDARREGGRRKRKPVSKKVVTKEYFWDEGHWLSDTQLEASFALWSDKRFFLKKKKTNTSFPGIPSDIESQLLYPTYLYSFSSTSFICVLL